ncbi:hypothetical protein I4U23_005012 [Adineta vaga]|nr:hypothetical protein I4U23_005012 [Adineta vaga]
MIMMKNIIGKISSNSLLTIGIFVLILNLIPIVASADASGDDEGKNLKAKLASTVTELDLQALLTDEQFVFDFNKTTEGVALGDGGRIVVASAAVFPALIKHDIAMAVGSIEPCGLVLPHTHRATELVYVSQGKFEAGFIQENGGRFIKNVIVAGQVVVFPEGSIHFAQNLNCEPAFFIASFNSADPGVQITADNAIKGLPVDIVAASLGISIKAAKDLRDSLPAVPSLGSQECRKKCKL